MTKEEIKLLDLIAQAIFDKKGINILALDVRGLSTMTDYFVIAEGSVGRHVKALATEIKHKMSDEGGALLQSEGESDGEWVVMDYGYIVIHLFTPDMREKYAFEELWSRSTIIDVKINTNPII
ncbi:MAG: ribosome silencing factor [Parachlamydiaceae bacterium]